MMNMSIVMMYSARIYREISYIHVISHRIYKRSIFLIAGYILMYNSGNQDMRTMSVPINLMIIRVLIISNLGICFVFTISTEHLFKILTIPTHMLIVPILALRVFFIMKITIKLLYIMSRGKSYVLVRGVKKEFFYLVLPICICICGNIYISKLQPIVIYEVYFNNMIFLILFIVIPIRSKHKSEVDDLAAIRLDQDLARERFINKING